MQIYNITTQPLCVLHTHAILAKERKRKSKKFRKNDWDDDDDDDDEKTKTTVCSTHPFHKRIYKSTHLHIVIM